MEDVRVKIHTSFLFVGILGVFFRALHGMINVVVGKVGKDLVKWSSTQQRNL